MGRYTGPVEKLSRREGVELFLKGERALNGKSALERRGAAPPGQHGTRRAQRPSIYATQLRAKQRAKRSTASVSASSAATSAKRSAAARG